MFMLCLGPPRLLPPNLVKSIINEIKLTFVLSGCLGHTVGINFHTSKTVQIKIHLYHKGMLHVSRGAGGKYVILYLDTPYITTREYGIPTYDHYIYVFLAHGTVL